MRVALLAVLAALLTPPACAAPAVSVASPLAVPLVVPLAVPLAVPLVVPPTVPLAGPPDFAALAARVLPAVVNIAATDAQPAAPARTAPGFFRRFMAGRAPAPPGAGATQSLGSGFLVSASGLIVTNNHVIAGARQIAVILRNQQVLPARLVGRDRHDDLALLRVTAGHPLPFLHWAPGPPPPVGSWVLAIGNPFGLGGSVTAGIVSALGRGIADGAQGGGREDFIQTDAPINRGNSGGPLFDMAGRVIGVNTAIYSPSGGSIGIGFAIPAAIARADIAMLRRYGHPLRGWLGVSAEAVTAPIAASLGLAGPGGVLVGAVAPGGPAARAGLRPGDAIRRLDGTPVAARDLERAIMARPPGTGITLGIVRDGATQTIPVRLGTSPAAAAPPPIPTVITPREMRADSPRPAAR